MSWQIFDGSRRPATVTVTKRHEIMFSASSARRSGLKPGDAVEILYDGDAGDVAVRATGDPEGWILRSVGGGGLVFGCRSFVQEVIGGAASVGKYPAHLFEHRGEVVVGFSLRERSQ